MFCMCCKHQKTKQKSPESLSSSRCDSISHLHQPLQPGVQQPRSWCGWRARSDHWLLRMSFSPRCCCMWLPLPGVYFLTCLILLFPVLPVLAYSSHVPDKLLWLLSYLVPILLGFYHSWNFILTLRDGFGCHLTRCNVREHRDHGHFCSCLYPRCLAQCLTIKA